MRDLKNLNCLLPDTKKLLLKMIDSCDFLSDYVLVGGSALTLYLCHRKSEDLDFFTFADSFDKEKILDFIKEFESKEILNQTDDRIDLLLDGVKVAFFNAKWAFLKPDKFQRLNVASLESICAMKTNVLFLRAKYRDYYDLYFLAHKFGFEQIFKYSKTIVEGMTFKLFAVALTYIDDIIDDDIEHLEPIKMIDKKEIRNFFEKELERLINLDKNL
jgi:predicted nucleotidyltransferase component of viral defense system